MKSLTHLLYIICPSCQTVAKFLQFSNFPGHFSWFSDEVDVFFLDIVIKKMQSSRVTFHKTEGFYH